MTAAFALDTILIWSVQILVLVGLGALAALTLSQPRARLLFWQGLLLILLLLPAVEPWKPTPPEAIPLIQDDGPPRIIEQTIPVAHHGWQNEYWLLPIAVGALLRLLWIATGFLSLRRYRKEARLLAEPPVPFGSAVAQWYLHDRLPGPVTYGWLRPSILLPGRFEQMEASVQEAIACHELIHVKRRDWLFVLAEEAVRVMFWFHPAVWFVLSRIQLAREQVVDAEVVQVTQDRDRYLDALVAVAAQKIRPDVAPAPLFLKKRHLAARVASILKEAPLSSTRLYAGFAAVGTAVLAAVRLSVFMIPFASQAQAIPDAPGVTVDPGAPVLHRTPIHRPGPAASGTVVVEANLNSKGEVIDAHVLSGPDELRKAALESVLQWHYSAGPSVVHVTIQIASTTAPTDGRTFAPTVRDPKALNGWPATLGTVRIIGLSQQAQEALKSRLPVHEGDTVPQDAVNGMMQSIESFDSHLRGTIRTNGDGHFDLEIALAAAPAQAAELDPGFPPPAEGVKRLRIGGNVQANNLVDKVQPRYPTEAKQSGIQGVVKLAALIGRDGLIQGLQLISGPPQLVPAATDAVKQWKYRPTLLNGNPVEVVTQIDINFTLAK